VAERVTNNYTKKMPPIWQTIIKFSIFIIMEQPPRQATDQFNGNVSRETLFIPGPKLQKIKKAGHNSLPFLCD
jgi:hypothetical protein